MVTKRGGVVAIGLFVVIGCGDGDDSADFDAAPAIADAASGIDVDPLAFAVSGTINGGSSGVVIAIWLADSGAGDTAYKFGQGTAAGGEFQIRFSGDPPPQAVFDLTSCGTPAQFGVGVLVLMPDGTDIPDGLLDEATGTQLQADVLGYSLQHAVIWRSGTITNGPDPCDFETWPNDFPDGEYGCGECVTGTPGFDDFAPTSCDTLVIETDPDAPSCNWT